MGSEIILEAIRKETAEANKVFLGYSWREKIEKMLEEQSRYTKLVRWCDKEIETRKVIIEVFNPADRTKEYTREYFQNYQNAIGELAMLVQFRELIIDEKCSDEQRLNIEYTIGKVFGIKYNETMGDYV